MAKTNVTYKHENGHIGTVGIEETVHQLLGKLDQPSAGFILVKESESQKVRSLHAANVQAFNEA